MATLKGWYNMRGGAVLWDAVFVTLRLAVPPRPHFVYFLKYSYP